MFFAWTKYKRRKYAESEDDMNETPMRLANNKNEGAFLFPIFMRFEHALQIPNRYKPIQCHSWKLKRKSANIRAIVIDLIKKLDREILTWILRA